MRKAARAARKISYKMANQTQLSPLKIGTFYHNVPLIFKFVYKGFLDHVVRAAGNVFIVYIRLFLLKY